MRLLNKVGRRDIDLYEMELNEYISDKLGKHEEIGIIGPKIRERDREYVHFLLKTYTIGS